MLIEFKKLMASRFFFTLAVQMQAVVIGWRMYELTHDPLHLGMIGLVEAVPAIGLALYAGYVVDRSRPLIVYRGVIFGSFFSGLVLLLSQFPQLSLVIHEQVIALFISSFLTGAARAFSQPSIFAAVPRLVPREQLSRASAFSTTTMQVARVSGPALGGLVFGFFGTQAAALLICSCLLVSICVMLFIRADVQPPAPSLVPTSRKQELLSGLRYVFKHPILFPALSLDMISVLFGGVTALLPIFASEILFVGPKGLGMLRAAPAVGAVIIGIWLTRKDVKEKAGTWLFASVAGFGASILVFGLSKNFSLSLAALAIGGGLDSISMVIRGTAVQLLSPDAMRGRIAAVNSIFIGSSNEIGEFESGVLARFMGTVPSVIFGGTMCLVTVLVMAVLSPQLRKMHLGKMEAME